MADTAVWPVDRVFPFVPVRQGVLTLPFPLRFLMAYDAVRAILDCLDLPSRPVPALPARPHPAGYLLA